MGMEKSSKNENENKKSSKNGNEKNLQKNINIFGSRVKLQATAIFVMSVRLSVCLSVCVEHSSVVIAPILNNL